MRVYRYTVPPAPAEDCSKYFTRNGKSDLYNYPSVGEFSYSSLYRGWEKSTAFLKATHLERFPSLILQSIFKHYVPDI